MIDPNREADVLMAFCHNGSMASVFFESVLAAFAYDNSQPRRRMVEYHMAQGPYIHDNRSRIARYFLECTDHQWLWFLDNDIQFQPDALYRLLEVAEGSAGTEEEIKILAAAYWNKYSGTAIYLSWLFFTPDGIRAGDRLNEALGPVVVHAAGMGCTLIHRSAMQAVADMYPLDPWNTFAADCLIRFEDGGYATVRYPEEAAEVLVDRPIKGIERMGEDVTWCLRAQKAGFKTWGLPSLVVEHFKPHMMSHGLNGAEIPDKPTQQSEQAQGHESHNGTPMPEPEPAQH